MLIALLALALTSSSSIHVCTVVEPGFNMLRKGVDSHLTVTSEDQLRGYHVDLRKLVLRNHNYTLQVLSSYAELQVRTRAGECDIGWAQFFITSARTSCTAACPALTSETASGSVSSMEPYRCCADFSVSSTSVSTGDIAILYSDRTLSFFEVSSQGPEPCSTTCPP